MGTKNKAGCDTGLKHRCVSLAAPICAAGKTAVKAHAALDELPLAAVERLNRRPQLGGAESAPHPRLRKAVTDCRYPETVRARLAACLPAETVNRITADLPTDELAMARQLSERGAELGIAGDKLAVVLEVGGPVAGPEVSTWPKPLPLIAETVADPYPMGALPGNIGRAVLDVAQFVQCPVALAACSALSTLSVAAQGLANVRRGPDLEGPVGLYLLTVAESGERKSEADRRFTAALRDWETKQGEMLKPDLAKSRADLAAWETEREAVLLKIKQARKAGRPTQVVHAELQELEREKPEAVRLPRLLLESETAESLAWNLTRGDGWPSGGIVTSEAGIVFGGHSMRRDTLMQNLSLLNKLWSGEPFRVGRRTSECYTMNGARLTMGLAVQPETVQAFFDESRGLARGTGFAARFLIAWPESTQGARPYRDAPAGWPGLSAFRAQLRRLLDVPLNFNDQGVLTPVALDMTPEAFKRWAQFHDETERELRSGGELRDVRDVASKAAENCARLAALFHLLEHGPHGAVAADHVVSAAGIVTWHLFEARRFLGGLALPKGLSNAAKLDTWLINECREQRVESVPARDVMRLGPNPVRRKVALTAALEELADAERVRLEDGGRTIRVNPALLGN